MTTTPTKEMEGAAPLADRAAAAWGAHRQAVDAEEALAQVERARLMDEAHDLGATAALRLAYDLGLMREDPEPGGHPDYHAATWPGLEDEVGRYSHRSALLFGDRPVGLVIDGVHLQYGKRADAEYLIVHAPCPSCGEEYPAVVDGEVDGDRAELYPTMDTPLALRVIGEALDTGGRHYDHETETYCGEEPEAKAPPPDPEPPDARTRYVLALVDLIDDRLEALTGRGLD